MSTVLSNAASLPCRCWPTALVTYGPGSHVPIRQLGFLFFQFQKRCMSYCNPLFHTPIDFLSIPTDFFVTHHFDQLMAFCRQCGRRFSRESSAKRHERTYHGNEQHRCSQCHVVFARRDNLQKHQSRCKESHTEQPIPTTMATPEDASTSSVNSTCDSRVAQQPSPSTPTLLHNDTNEMLFDFLSPFSMPTDPVPAVLFPDSNALEREVLGRVDYLSPFTHVLKHYSQCKLID